MTQPRYMCHVGAPLPWTRWRRHEGYTLEKIPLLVQICAPRFTKEVGGALVLMRRMARLALTKRTGGAGLALQRQAGDRGFGTNEAREGFGGGAWRAVICRQCLPQIHAVCYL